MWLHSHFMYIVAKLLDSEQCSCHFLLSLSLIFNSEMGRLLSNFENGVTLVNFYSVLGKLLGNFENGVNLALF
jgi:hypothetical protein